MGSLALVSIGLALVVGVLGAIDGVYFHFWKFRLHERPQSVREHVTHGVRAALIAPTVALLFIWPATGMMLWVVVGLMAADFAVMLWDLSEEPASRRDLGGIPHTEYVIHVVAASLHAASYALALASRPLEAWSPGAAAIALAPIVTSSAQLIFPGAVVIALAHFALLHPRVATLMPRMRAAT